MMLMRISSVEKLYAKELSVLGRKTAYKKAVAGVSFDINEGEIIGLVGESGCGKSTLSRMIIGLEKTTNGEILYNNENIWRLKRDKLKEFRKGCQIIFQDTLESLNPRMKVSQILMEPLDNHYSLSKKEKLDKIKEMMDLVMLDREFLERYPTNMSGGERQRVNICRALLLNPKLLICDEIVSSLDVTTQVGILHLLKGLNQKLDMSILFISHDISVVKFLCEKIMVMYDGSIVEEINKVKGNWEKATHLYTKMLLSSVPINHPKLRKENCI